MNGNYQTSIIAGVVALIFIGGALVLGLAIAGQLDEMSTPLVVTIFGFIGLAVTTLLTIVRVDRSVEQTKKLTDGVATKLDVIEKKVEDQSPHP